MKATITSTTYHSSALHLGLVIHGPENSWVRFAQVSVEAKDVSVEDLALFARAVVEAHLEERDNKDEPLF